MDTKNFKFENGGSMKKVFIFFIITCSILLMVCGKGTCGKRSGLYELQVFLGSSGIESMEMDESFYEALLDSFCCVYYDRKLPGFYVSESVCVTGVSRKDTHTVEVRGIHSFKGRDFIIHQQQYDNRGFVAMVIYNGNGEYLINFGRRLELPWPMGSGVWTYSGELPLIYKNFLLHKLSIK